jgi:hypothetical protein
MPIRVARKFSRFVLFLVGNGEHGRGPADADGVVRCLGCADARLVVRLGATACGGAT